MAASTNERLRHMRDFAVEASQLASGKTKADLQNARTFRLAMERLLELVGEAATRIPTEFRESHAQIPWRSITGLRNWLIHGYIDIDQDIVWSTIANDLPILVRELDAILSDKAQQ